MNDVFELYERVTKLEAELRAGGAQADAEALQDALGASATTSTEILLALSDVLEVLAGSETKFASTAGALLADIDRMLHATGFLRRKRR